MTENNGLLLSSAISNEKGASIDNYNISFKQETEMNNKGTFRTDKPHLHLYPLLLQNDNEDLFVINFLKSFSDFKIVL